MKNKKGLILIIAMFFGILTMSLVLFPGFNSVDLAEGSYEYKRTVFEEAEIFASGKFCDKGGQIFLSKGVSYTMNAGVLSNGISEKGGSIYVSSGATFTLNGGTICGNSAVYGGAIYVEAGGKVYLNGGEIYGNRAQLYTNGSSAIYAENSEDVIISENFSFGENEVAMYSITLKFYVDNNLRSSRNITLSGNSISYNAETGKFSYTLVENQVPVSFENCAGYFLDSNCTKSAHKGAIDLVNTNVLNLYTKSATKSTLGFINTQGGCAVYYNYGTIPENLVIPAEYNNKPVIQTCLTGSLGAFEYCTTLKTVQLPSMLTNITQETFYGCTSLTTVAITDMVESIGDRAFTNCKSFVRNVNETSYLNFPESVKTIGRDAFANTGITGVALNSIETLGVQAFVNCSKLTRIYNTGLVQSLNSYSFGGCSALTVVNLSSNLREIGVGSFAGCTKLTSISLPSSLTTIGDQSFKGSALKNVIIPANVTSIGANPFLNCSSLTQIFVANANINFKTLFTNTLLCSYDGKSVILALKSFSTYASSSQNYFNGTVTEIKSYALYEISGLPHIQSSKIVNIGQYAFSKSDINSLIIRSESLKIDNYALIDCSNLEYSYVPSNTTIGSYAFQNCTSLKQFKIESGQTEITTIGVNAFKNCTSLTEIFLPINVTTISSSVENYSTFYGCTNMQAIFTEYESKPSAWGNYFNYKTNSEQIPVVYNVSEEEYINLDLKINNDWLYYISEVDGNLSREDVIIYKYLGSAETVQVPEILPFDNEDYYVLEISSNVFKNNTMLKEVTIPDCVINIQEHVFYGCVNLTNVTLGESLSYIGYGAFEGCQSLTSLVIPNSVEEIGIDILFNCTSINSLTTPQFRDGASDNEFLGIMFGAGSWGEQGSFVPESLKSVTLTEGESIYAYSFYDCQNLTTINISSGIEDIEAYSFYNCKNLTTITLPNTIITIGDYAFYGCSALRYNGLLPIYNISYLGKSAFENCSSLTGVDLTTRVSGYITENAETITENAIPFKAFKGCSSLETILLFDEVETIGQYAFDGCQSLTNINLESESTLQNELVNVKTVTYRAFGDCTSLNQIYLPNLSGVGTYIFSGCTSLKNIFIPGSLAGIKATALYNTDFTIFTSYLEDSKPVAWETGWNNKNDSETNPVIWGVTYEQYIYWISNPGFEYSFTNGIGTDLDKVFVTITKYIGLYDNNGVLKSNIETPDIYSVQGKDYIVTSIGKDAFLGSSSLQTVGLDNNITTIGYGAFKNCSSLKSIIIPDSVTRVGQNIFEGCTSLESIKTPIMNNGQYDGEWIGMMFGATQESEHLEKVPSALKTFELTKGSIIYASAFANCAYIENIILPNTITSIEEYAFSGCSSLSEIATASVLNLGDYAFENCSSLTIIELPKISGTLGLGAFKNCSALITIDLNSDELKWLGVENEENGEWVYYTDAFAGCSSLETLIIGKNIKTILGHPVAMLEDCVNLKTLTIPFVLNIGSLWGADSPTENKDKVPSSLKIVNITNSDSSGSFYECNNIEEINYIADVEQLKTIETSAFFDCSKLKKITGINYVTTLNEYAFSGCSNLIEMKLPLVEGIIGADCFYDCVALEEVLLGDEVTEIGSYAFKNCERLTSFTIGQNVTNIKFGAFENCSALEVIDLANVKIIWDRAFAGCTNLSIITLWNTETIYLNSFKGCTSLQKIYLPASVTTIESEVIGDSIFLGCVGMIGEAERIGIYCEASESEMPGSWGPYFNYASENDIIEVHYSVTRDEFNNEQYRFTSDWIYMTYSDDELSFTDSGENIKGKLIKYIGGSKTIEFPTEIDGIPINWIGSEVLAGKSGISPVYIPSCYTKIDADAFKDTNMVIYCESASIPSNWVEGWDNKDNSGGKNPYVLSVSLDQFNFAKNYPALVLNFDLQNEHNVIITKEIGASGTLDLSKKDASSYNIVTIKENVFNGNKDINRVILPDTISSIGNYAFYSCSNLYSVIFSNDTSLTIGEYAFSFCTKLTNINLPQNLTTLPTGIFAGSGLITISLSSDLTKIGNKAFLSCQNLGSIEIPCTVTEIGYQAFANCINMTFANNTSLPSGLTSLGESAFSRCKSITGAITIPAGLTQISQCAFEYCEGIKNVYFAEDSLLTTIGNGAFFNCSTLEHIQLPERIETINSAAFAFCGNLMFMYLPSGICSIASDINKSTGKVESGYDYLSLYMVNEDFVLYYQGTDDLSTKSARSYDISVINIKTLISSTEGRIETPVKCLTVIGQTVANYQTAYGEFGVNDSGEIHDYRGGSTVVIPNKVFNLGLNEKGLLVVQKKDVVSIGNEAFSGDSITSVKCSSGVNLKEIGDKAFFACTSLTKVDLQNCGATTIGASAFGGCTKVSKIILPTTIETLGERAFELCGKLTNIVGFNGIKITILNQKTFYLCESLEKVELPSTIKTIYEDAFEGCSSVSEILIQKNLTSILNSSGNTGGSLEKLSGLKKAIIEYGATKIIEHLFMNCDTLEEVSIPTTITSVGDQAFYNCTSLKEINLPDTVTELGEWTFFGCSSLTSFYIPKQCNSLNFPFIGCDDSLKLYVYATSEDEANSNFKGNTNWTYYEYVGNDATAKKLEVTYCKNPPDFVVNENGVLIKYNGTKTDITIPVQGSDAYGNISYNINTIGATAFEGVENIRTISFATGSLVTEIGAWAFYENSSLTAINWNGAHITTIGEEAFANCTALTSIIIPSGVTEIGANLFDGCTSLKSVTIPSSVETIGEKAFTNCTALTSIIIPSGVTEMGANLFDGCTSLQSITIPSSVETIGEKAFTNCTSLKSLTIPNSVTSLGGYVIFGCDLDELTIEMETIPEGIFTHGFTITKMTITNSVKNAESAFEKLVEWSGYEGIKHVDINMETISMNMFAASSIESVTLGSSVSNIEYGAFMNCEKLTSVTFGKNLKVIGSCAFKETKIEKVKLSSTNIEVIGGDAFRNCYYLRIIELPNKSNLTIEANAFYNAGTYLSGFDLYVFIPLNVALDNIKNNAFANGNTGVDVYLFVKNPSNVSWTKVNYKMYGTNYNNGSSTSVNSIDGMYNYILSDNSSLYEEYYSNR